MVYIIGVPLLLIFALIESTVLANVRVLGGTADLILLAVVSWALTGREREAMVLALIGGFFLDMLSGLPFGTTSIILVLIVYFVSLFEGRLWEANILMPLAAIIAASLTYHILRIAVVFLSGRQVDIALALTRVVMPSTFLNLLLVLPFSQAANGIRKALYPPEVQI